MLLATRTRRPPRPGPGAGMWTTAGRRRSRPPRRCRPETPPRICGGRSRAGGAGRAVAGGTFGRSRTRGRARLRAGGRAEEHLPQVGQRLLALVLRLVEPVAEILQPNVQHLFEPV